MLKSFLRHYLELPAKNANISCLGGGVGTAQILRGLKLYPYNLTAIVSMADDGGSAGRLRRAFSILPPGDLVTCLTALSKEESILKDLFLYRFAGKRYGNDTDLGGQKLGNLIFVALTDIYKGDSNRALEEFSKIISPTGKVLPATIGNVNIWAKTKEGKNVYGESNIDLGKYNGSRSLKKVYLNPPKINAYKNALEAINQSNQIIVGPGDLFTTVLPVLIVSQIQNLIKKIKVKKIFIVNIANKPYETAGFKVSDYLKTLEDHLGKNIFDTIFVNTNQKPKIPAKINYKYVEYDKTNLKNYVGKIIEGDFVNESYPVYHDSEKIAKAIGKLTL